MKSQESQTGPNHKTSAINASGISGQIMMFTVLVASTSPNLENIQADATVSTSNHLTNLVDQSAQINLLTQIDGESVPSSMVDAMLSLCHQVTGTNPTSDNTSKSVVLLGIEQKHISQNNVQPQIVNQESENDSPLLIESLSVRECEVMRLVMAGYSNKDIAVELVISLGTVKRHLSNIYGKLGVHSRTQAISRSQAFNLL